MSAPRDQSCPLNEQAVGWALHALEPDEEMALMRHFPQCPSCQAAASGAEEVLAHLGTAVEQVEPPRSLRDSVLSAAADTPQKVQPRHARRTPAPRTIERVPPTRRAHSRRRTTWATRRRLIGATFALVGVLAIGGLAVRTAQLQQQSETLSAQAQSIADLVGQLDRPGVEHAILSGDNGATTAAVLLVDGQRQVYTVGLPANAKDKSYVLWGIRDGADPKALGAFDVTPVAEGARPVGTVGRSDGFTAYAISIEPGRTLPAKPSTVVAKGPVEA